MLHLRLFICEFFLVFYRKFICSGRYFNLFHLKVYWGDLEIQLFLFSDFHGIYISLKISLCSLHILVDHFHFGLFSFLYLLEYFVCFSGHVISFLKESLFLSTEFIKFFLFFLKVRKRCLKFLLHLLVEMLIFLSICFVH